jgi:sugar phosphate isomerase/epimerase
MQMKLGFIGDNDLPGVEADAQFAKEHGFDGLEYNWWGNFKEVTPATIKQMAKIHKKHGTRASMLGIWGWNHLAPEKAVRAEARAMLDRAIEYAQVLGADVLVTGAGDIPGEPVGRKVREFVEVMGPYVKKIQKAGLTPAFYAVHGASFLDSLATFERVLEHLPEVKIKFDPANWDHHGDDYIEVVRRYGNKVGYVHIKDHLRHQGNPAAAQPPAGMGDIAFPKVLAFLYEHDYRGWLSIEPHGSLWGRGELRRKMLLLSQRYITQWLV